MRKAGSLRGPLKHKHSRVRECRMCGGAVRQSLICDTCRSPQAPTQRPHEDKYAPSTAEDVAESSIRLQVKVLQDAAQRYTAAGNFESATAALHLAHELSARLP